MEFISHYRPFSNNFPILFQLVGFSVCSCSFSITTPFVALFLQQQQQQQHLPLTNHLHWAMMLSLSITICIGFIIVPNHHHHHHYTTHLGKIIPGFLFLFLILLPVCFWVLWPLYLVYLCSLHSIPFNSVQSNGTLFQLEMPNVGRIFLKMAFTAPFRRTIPEQSPSNECNLVCCCYIYITTLVLSHLTVQFSHI